MSLGAWDYAAVFAVSSALTLVLTPLAVRYAIRLHLLDLPGEIKAQESPVPYLGGAAIVLSFSLVVLVAAVARFHTPQVGELAVIMGLAVALGVMGLVDDLRGLSPWLRLAVEAAVAVGVWASPAGADVLPNDFLNLLATLAWIVAVTNAFNLLDNMDGLSAGVASIAALFVFILAAGNGQFLVATLAAGLAGCSLGFLRSNFHPARIYMGDAGSLFLGYMLAVLTLKLDFVNAPRSVALAVPVVLLGVPLFDTILVTCNRLLHDRSPLSGGRDHTSHRLVFIGVPVPATVTLIYLAAGSLGCLALVLSRVDRTPGLILVGWMAAVAGLLGILLSAVPVYESSRRRHLMIQEVARRETDAPMPVTEVLDKQESEIRRSQAPRARSVGE